MAAYSRMTGEETAHPEVLVIALKEPDMSHVRGYFPAARHLPAVDLRSSAKEDIARARLISFNAADTLQRGRKWHKELPGTGAVGLHQSNRAAMHLSDPNRPLLLLEEDCVLRDGIKEEIAALLESGEAFDVAVFGCTLLDGSVTECKRSGWFTLGPKSSFITTHCVLYTAIGKQKMKTLLDMPQEIQIDAFLGLMYHSGNINLILNFDSALAHQRMHLSSIQEMMGTCSLCNYEPGGMYDSSGYPSIWTVALLLMLVVVASVGIAKHTRVS